MVAIWAALAMSAPQTQVLERGLDGYWACEDTTLDSRDADFAQGGNAILEGGPGRTVLIQFKDLDHAIGPNRRVTKASLVLVYGRRTPKFSGIRTVKQPWTEGPIRALSQQLGSLRRVSRWAATWNHRRSGPEADPWKLAGARGEEDADAIAGVTSRTQGNDELVIEGLGPAVQAQYARWYENHGFALEFSEDSEFLSSNATEGRPRLIVETEPIDTARGPDLSVTLISRKPEYPAFNPTFATVDQIAAPLPPADPSEQRWPFEGEELTYEAEITNLGDARAEPFDVQWRPQERPGPLASVTESLEPGQSVRVTFKHPFRTNHADHRANPIGVRLFPKGPDARASNDFLEIQQNALNLAVFVSEAYVASVGPGFATELQHELRRFNEVYLNYSRYSFAPEGALERVRIQRIDRVANLDAATDPNADGVVKLDEKLSREDLYRRFAVALGLVDLRSLPGQSAPYPGILGGDTRSDALFPGTLSIPIWPDPDPITTAVPLDRYGLLSAVDIAALNANLGRRGGYSGTYLYGLPNNLLVTAMDRSGKRLSQVELRFFQVQEGDFPERPTFAVKTDAGGLANLPNRPIGVDAAIQVPGHSLRANPFGRIDLSGLNGVFRIDATVNGITDSTYLTGWHLVQNYHRGQREVGLVTLRFNVPGNELEAEPVAKLAKEGGLETEVANEFVDIDLGRNVNVGEVRIAASAVWDRFDLVGWSSGETAAQARPFGREVFGTWALANRREAGSLVYRGRLDNVRTLRIWRRGSGDMKLAEIVVRRLRD